MPCHRCFRIVTVAQAARSVFWRKHASRHSRRQVQTWATLAPALVTYGLRTHGTVHRKLMHAALQHQQPSGYRELHMYTTLETEVGLMKRKEGGERTGGGHWRICA